jgi:hypothetical protein
MRVRLTAKLAEVVNGIDLSPYTEGDIIELSEHDAQLLIAEKWAETVDQRQDVAPAPSWLDDRAIAADRGAPNTLSRSSRRGGAPSDGVA